MIQYFFRGCYVLLFRDRCLLLMLSLPLSLSLSLSPLQIVNWRMEERGLSASDSVNFLLLSVVVFSVECRPVHNQLFFIPNQRGRKIALIYSRIFLMHIMTLLQNKKHEQHMHLKLLYSLLEYKLLKQVFASSTRQQCDTRCNRINKVFPTKKRTYFSVFRCPNLFELCCRRAARERPAWNRRLLKTEGRKRRDRRNAPKS